MKKLLTVSMILVFIFAVTLSVYADEMELKSVDAILTEIQQEQGVQSTDEIDPDAVSQAKLEELGDSVMEAMIGNSAIHDQMDIKLGGDGSASLTAFHSRLGYNYLVGYPNGMMSLMTSGMMGTINDTDGKAVWNGMMGNSNYIGCRGMMGYLGWGGMVIGAAIFILFIIILIFIIKAIIRKPTAISTESPLDILKKRYALGELNREEYEKMAELLRK